MKIKTADFLTSATGLAACPASSLPEFALIGRSNVGKSSLLNLLAGKKDLAKVSSAPGHTRLINFFPVNESWTLVDLPGYGYAETIRSDKFKFQAMIGEYLTGRENLVRVFVLIDSRHSPQKIDVEFVQWAAAESVPFALIFTKIDKLGANAVQKNVELFLEKIAAFCPQLPPFFKTSSEKRIGRDEVLKFIGDSLA